MENANQIVAPHLNAEIYRTNTYDTSKGLYLDYIDLHEDGSVLIGQSELTGRYWNGAASIYKTVGEAQNATSEDNCNIVLTSGTSDGCFVGSSNRVLTCEDSGAISIWTKNIDETSNVWHSWSEVLLGEHDDAALAVDCLESGNLYVTVGADGNAKVWNVNERLCVRNYDAVHDLPIYGVSVRPQSSTTFATCSMDQYTTMWDESTVKPVLDIAKNNCGVRCLKWLDENRLVFGDEAGVLSLVDVRNPGSLVKATEFPAAVHKVAVNSDSSRVAVCCDNKIVSVCKLSEDDKCNIIYHDRHLHSDHVRGVVWANGDASTLYSIGWDGQIITHCVP